MKKQTPTKKTEKSLSVDNRLDNIESILQELKDQGKKVAKNFNFVRRDIHNLYGQMSDFRVEMIEEFRKHRDHSNVRFDDIVGQLADLREDNIIGTHQIRELRGDVDELAKRVQKLEKTQSSS